MPDELKLRYRFEKDNIKYLLATDDMGKLDNTKLGKFLTANMSDFWKHREPYETMILKKNPVFGVPGGSGYNIGYYVERFDTKKEATKGHNRLKKLIEDGKYILFHTNDMEGMMGEFIF